MVKVKKRQQIAQEFAAGVFTKQQEILRQGQARAAEADRMKKRVDKEKKKFLHESLDFKTSLSKSRKKRQM